MAKPYQFAASRQYYQQHYVEKGESVYILAELLNCSPNKCRNDMMRYGIKLRTKAESQRLALEAGRSILPRHEIDPELKEIQAIAAARAHSHRTPEQKQRLSDAAKKRYDSMSEESREKFHSRNNKALKKIARNGSELEKYLLVELNHWGFLTHHQAKYLVDNQKLSFDLWIPELKVVIECDGISHIRDIYNNPAAFEAKVARDFQKNALVISAGCCIIRLRYEKTPTKSKKFEVRDKLIALLERIKLNFPKPEDRLVVWDMENLPE